MKPIATIVLHPEVETPRGEEWRSLHRQVEKWAEDNGLLIGPMQRDDPRAMVPADGEWDSVSKWRLLTKAEQRDAIAVARFGGVSMADLHRGPVAVIEVRRPLGQKAGA